MGSQNTNQTLQIFGIAILSSWGIPITYIEYFIRTMGISQKKYSDINTYKEFGTKKKMTPLFDREFYENL